MVSGIIELFDYEICWFYCEESKNNRYFFDNKTFNNLIDIQTYINKHQKDLEFGLNNCYKV